MELPGRLDFFMFYSWAILQVGYNQKKITDTNYHVQKDENLLLVLKEDFHNK